jgi:hypothetical protein
MERAYYSYAHYNIKLQAPDAKSTPSQEIRTTDSLVRNFNMQER